jgi:hypothetical protein
MRKVPSLLLFVSLALSTCGDMSLAPAHEYSTDPKMQEWFENLRQPDYPWQSCCGEADSYFADDFERGPNGEWIAIITDGRDDAVPCPACEDGIRMRLHREPGTKIVVPDSKIKFDQGNPTGHGLIFMPQYSGPNEVPYCFLPPSGA